MEKILIFPPILLNRSKFLTMIAQGSLHWSQAISVKPVCFNLHFKTFPFMGVKDKRRNIYPCVVDNKTNYSIGLKLNPVDYHHCSNFSQEYDNSWPFKLNMFSHSTRFNDLF